MNESDLKVDTEILDQLKQHAKSVSKNSYSPYSKFPVGAALISGDDEIFTGVNVENASYGLTICAERNAIFSAVAKGATSVKSVVIYTPTQTPTPPCGACRQVIAEFSDAPEVVSICDSEQELVISADQLLPHSFSL